jgi:RNA polymerase sigma-70 factor (ECF subfamily)
MSATDAELVAKARGGDHDAFADLVERHRARVRRLAFSLLGHSDMADDCVQLTYLRAWQRLEQLDDSSRFASWVRAICRSIAANMREREGARRQREGQVATGVPGPGGADELITRIWIREAVEALPEPYRRSVYRFYFDGLSQREIARELDLRVGTVKKRLHDARSKLKEALAEMRPTKELTGLRWRPRWVSALGCIKGCLEHLGRDVSWGWIYGGCGHGFVINIHEELCPSGPTSWGGSVMSELGVNVGFRAHGIVNAKRDGSLPEAQQAAWQMVRDAIDKGLPCYGWELAIPEFYVIYGYDDIGYYYSGPGCSEGAGPKPWRELGKTGIGVVEMQRVEPCPPAATSKVVKDSLSFALRFAERGERVLPGYCFGPAAFDAWAEALEAGRAGRFGQGYNAEVWAECRGEAVNFLREAKGRLPGKAEALFDEAIARYSVVHSRLKALVDMYSFVLLDQLAPEERVKSSEGAALLREAGAAERQGLSALGRIFDSI